MTQLLILSNDSSEHNEDVLKYTLDRGLQAEEYAGFICSMAEFDSDAQIGSLDQFIVYLSIHQALAKRMMWLTASEVSAYSSKAIKFNIPNASPSAIYPFMEDMILSRGHFANLSPKIGKVGLKIEESISIHIYLENNLESKSAIRIEYSFR